MTKESRDPASGLPLWKTLGAREVTKFVNATKLFRSKTFGARKSTSVNSAMYRLSESPSITEFKTGLSGQLVALLRFGYGSWTHTVWGFDCYLRYNVFDPGRAYNA